MKLKRLIASALCASMLTMACSINFAGIAFADQAMALSFSLATPLEPQA